MFAALIGKRSYKDKLPKEEVINILLKLVSNNKIDADITNIIICNFQLIKEEVKKITEPYLKINEEINIKFNELVDLNNL